MEALNPLCGIVCRLTFPSILSLSVIKRTLYHIVNCFSGFLNVQVDEMVVVPITCGVIDVGPRSLLGAHICVIEDRVKKMTLHWYLPNLDDLAPNLLCQLQQSSSNPVQGSGPEASSSSPMSTGSLSLSSWLSSTGSCSQAKQSTTNLLLKDTITDHLTDW